MHTLSIPHAKELVRHIAIRKNHPVMLWGPSGVGKSDLVAQLVEELDGVLVDIRLSQYDSVDLRGFPGVDPTTSLTKWHAPSTLPFVGNDAFPDDKLVVLFLDEVNSASIPVFAAIYQLILNHRIGEFPLKPNVRIVAAGNREGDRGVTNRMPAPLAGRFRHAEVGIDVETFCSWGQKQGLLPPVAIAFHHFRKELLSTFNPTSTAKSFGTPRSWMAAWNYFQDAEMPDHIKMAAMAGAVGDGESNEAWGFVSVWKSMTPIAEIIKNPKTVKLPEEASMRYAMAVAVSGSMTPKTSAPLNTYLLRLDPEYLALAWQLAIHRDEELTKTPEFVGFAQTFRTVWSN